MAARNILTLGFSPSYWLMRTEAVWRPLINPSSHSRSNATCPQGRSWIPRLLEAWVGGWGDSYLSPFPFFGCENHLLLGRNVSLSWNSLSFPEPSHRHLHTQFSIVPQEGLLVSDWQLQGICCRGSGWGTRMSPHLTLLQGNQVASTLVEALGRIRRHGGGGGWKVLGGCNWTDQSRLSLGDR